MFAPYLTQEEPTIRLANEVEATPRETREKVDSDAPRSTSWLGVPASRVLMTLNQLAVMNQNGVEIVEALDAVASQCRDPRLAQSLDDIHESVSEGNSFSSAVLKHGTFFPPTLGPMLAAAEATGRVPETLKRVCERMRGELTLKAQIVGAMIYPIILLGASSTVMAALVMGVLPQFTKVFESLGRPVPLSTQYLLTFGVCCREHWPLILLGVGACLVLGFVLRSHPMVTRPWYRFLLFAPLIRDAYRPLAAGRAFRTLAAMVGGGVPLLQAVRLTRDTTRDVYWIELWDDVEESLIQGTSASDAFRDVEFIPREAAQMVATAERTGRVAEVLDDIGTFYEEDASRKIKRLVVALEPVIILVMGVVVAGVVMSVMLPLLDVSTVQS